jgi:hypothetical protein
MGSVATLPSLSQPPDTSSFFGGSTQAQTAPLTPPATTLTVPTGGAPAESAGTSYTPQKPNLLALNSGMGSMQRLFQQVYGSDSVATRDRPPGQTALAENPVTGDTTDTAANTTDTANAYLQHGQQVIAENQNQPSTQPTLSLDATDRAVGNATTFGLDYDTKGYDQEDNGKGAFGYNTRDPNLEGASLPIQVIKNSIGDYTRDPKVFNAIKTGQYKVAVTNADGTTRVVNLVDAGPAEWTGNAVDLTYKTSHDLGTNGKAKVGYQIIGPDGHPVPVKGYHADSVSHTNWYDHVDRPKPKPAEDKGDEIEDMGEKPKEGRSEEPAAKKKETTAQTDASYGRYGKDIPADQTDQVLEEAQRQLAEKESE